MPTSKKFVPAVKYIVKVDRQGFVHRGFGVFLEPVLCFVMGLEHLKRALHYKRIFAAANNNVKMLLILWSSCVGASAHRP